MCIHFTHATWQLMRCMLIFSLGAGASPGGSKLLLITLPYHHHHTYLRILCHCIYALQWRHNELDGVSKSPASRLFTQPLIQAKIKENIKAPRHWPLCGEFTGDRWIPRAKGKWRGKCFHLMTSSLCINLKINPCWLGIWISDNMSINYGM